MPNWFGLATAVFGRLPIERWLIKPRDTTKSLEELATRLSESQNNAPLSTLTTINTQKATAAPERQDIATACVACAVGHFAGAAKLLNEAFRFRDDGITSNQVLDDIAGAIGELNAMERVDLTPEKLQNTSSGERPIADEALRESRKLRHRLEGISSMEEIEKAAADSESFYKKLFRGWFKQRFAHLGPAKAQIIAEEVDKLSPEDKDRVLKSPEDLNNMAKCPQCGGPLDKDGCCKKCNICVLKGAK